MSSSTAPPAACTKDDYAQAQAAKQFYANAVATIMDGSVSELDTLIKEFLKKHQDVTLEDVLLRFHSEGKTMLHLAASSGNFNIVESIVSQAKRPTELINQADIAGMTPIINATISESTRIMSYLIGFKADVNARNRDGASAIHFAAGDGSVERLELLVNAGADVALVSNAGSALHWACGKARADAVRFLVEKECPLDAQGSGGLPAIILAAASFSDECVSLLVQAGADLGFIVTGNLTALHLAAENGLELSVKSILESANDSGRACCSIATDDGNLPLHLAAMGGNKAIVSLLLPFSPLSALVDKERYIRPEVLASASADTVFANDMLLAGPSMCNHLLEAIVADGKERLSAWEQKHMPKQAEGDAPAIPHPHIQDPALPAMAPITDPVVIEQANDLKAAGNAHFRDKDYAKSIECYRQAILLHPDNEVLWSNSSAAKLSAGDHEGALADAEVCRRLKPEWTKGCFRLAAARLALEMYEESAIAAFEGSRLDENNADLKSILREAVKQGQLAHQAKLARGDSSA
jgi:ankyrin repeat protein